jgi:amidase
MDRPHSAGTAVRLVRTEEAETELHEYSQYDAVGLRELIGSGEVSAAEVENAARMAVAAVNPELNALTLPLFDEALDHDPDGPLGGVPFLIKDIGPFARGVPFTLGSRSVQHAVARDDHELMRRFRATGLAVLGQTTAPELSLSFATESARYGITRNPWALDRGVGGSSGGAAALVAAGAVPVAHAGDAAGSIRVPASSCGLVGLKPTRNRTPSGPDVAAGGLVLGVEFALSRTVRDTAQILAAVASPLPDDPAESLAFAEEVRLDPGLLRVALTTASWSGAPTDPEVESATIAAARALEWIGHVVSEASPDIDIEVVIDAEMLSIYSAGTALITAPVPPDVSLLEAVSRRVVSETKASTASDVLASIVAQQRTAQEIENFFYHYDLLVTPTMGQLPALHGTLDYDDPGYTTRAWLARLFEFAPFTAPFNVSGNPAISLPLGESRAGLPIGVQLVAARGREGLLLRVAAQLEQAMPWNQRQPSIFAD